MYRSCSLGEALERAIKDFGEELSEDMQRKFMATFDMCVQQQFQALENQNTQKPSVNGYCKNYKFCDDVWRFDVADCDLTKSDGDHKIKSEKCIVVAQQSEQSDRPIKTVKKKGKH